jgi:mono/diheme cytochrome c family protein
MMTLIKNIGKVAVGALILAGCSASGDYPGIEYAPQMYHSVAYEPLSQITEDGIPSGPISSWYYLPNSLPYNKYNGEKPINQLEPVQGTVARQSFSRVTGSNAPFKGQELLLYDLHKDSIDLAAKILKNPLQPTEQLLAEGKHLYIGFCAACHGESGQGEGKVGEVYKGVPNYSAGRYATLSEGHIFHTITHGKGRMWAHKSQINPEERWKIVLYVQKLQKGEK